MTYKTKITTCKIKDIAKIYKGKGLTLDKVNSFEGKPCILYGDLYTKYETIAENIIHKTIFDEGLLSKANSVLIPGDTTADAWGMAKAVALKEKNILLGSSINILELNDNCDNIFFAYYLSSKKRKDIAKLVEGSTILHLYGKDIKEIEITYPEFSEQKKIGCFFKEIDDLIDLSKKEIICIDKYKNYLLKEVFNEANIKIKIDELGDVKTGKTPSTTNENNYGDEYLWVTPTDITSRFIDKTERMLSKEGIKNGVLIPKESILVTCVGSFGKNIISTSEISCNQQINYITNTKYNYMYIYYLIKANEKRIKSFAQKGVIDIITLNVFKDINVNIHRKQYHDIVAKIFDNIDSLIETKEKHIKLLETKKKYYLNKIFC